MAVTAVAGYKAISAATFTGVDFGDYQTATEAALNVIGRQEDSPLFVTFENCTFEGGLVDYVNMQLAPMGALRADLMAQGRYDEADRINPQYGLGPDGREEDGKEDHP